MKNVLAIAAALLLAAGCSRQLSEKQVEQKVRDYWHSCREVVAPDKFQFERVDKRTVRVSYVLRVLNDPPHPVMKCNPERLARLGQLLGGKAVALVAKGSEVPVIEEASLQ